MHNCTFYFILFLCGEAIGNTYNCLQGIGYIISELVFDGMEQDHRYLLGELAFFKPGKCLRGAQALIEGIRERGSEIASAEPASQVILR